MVMPPLATALVAGAVVLLVAWALRQRLAVPRRSPVQDAVIPASEPGERRGTDPTSRRGRLGRAGRFEPTPTSARGSSGSDDRLAGDDEPPTFDIVRRPPSRRWLRRRPGLAGNRAAASRSGRPTLRWPRRAPSIEHHLAEWCTGAARAVRAGDSLPDAVAAATDDVPAMATVFGPVRQAQHRGVSLSTALSRVSSTDASVVLVVAVVRTCARLGGSAAAPLDRTAAVMHARLAALAERRVKSAQARMSAVVMTTTPFAVLMLLVALEPSVRSSFALTATWMCLAVGVLLNLIGWWWMRRIIRSAESPRTRPWSRGPSAAQLALPDGIELLVCCLHAGLSPPQLVDAVAGDLPPALHPAFDAVRHRMQRGHRFADALDELPKVIGHEAHSLADSIAAADRYGLPLAPVLERLAAEAVDTRRRLGEIAARKLPVRLSFPLVGTVLPAFVLVALAPAVIGAVSTLRIY